MFRRSIDFRQRWAVPARHHHPDDGRPDEADLHAGCDLQRLYLAWGSVFLGRALVRRCRNQVQLPATNGNVAAMMGMVKKTTVPGVRSSTARSRVVTVRGGPAPVMGST